MNNLYGHCVKVKFVCFVLFISLLTSMFPNKVKAESDKLPLYITYTSSYGYITLNWDTIFKAEYYKVYRRVVSEKSYTCLTGDGTKERIFIDKKISDGWIYLYYVEAYSKSGKVIAVSEELSGYRYCMDDKICFDQRVIAPEGCELFALATLLHYNGVEVDPMELVKKVPKESYPYSSGNVRYGGNPDRGFVGNPSGNGYGVWHEPIAELGEKYLSGIIDMTGSSLSDVLYQIDDGNPVMVWIIINNNVNTRRTQKWKDDKTGEEVVWKIDNHAVVIIGYTSDTVIVADSLSAKIVAYDYNDFEENYEYMGRQALYYEK